MTAPWLIVAGDFRPTGGMDRANYQLAWYLAETLDRPVHLVAHHVTGPLARHRNVQVYPAARPFGIDLLAEPFLDWTGRRVAARLRAREPALRVLVNGGNCLAAGVNWVHYVHAADAGDNAGSWPRRVVRLLKRHRYRGQERRAFEQAPLLIANSERTRRDLVEKLGVAEERVRVVYLAADPTRFRPPSAGERAEARLALGWPADVPFFLFVGSPHEHRKGFDVVWSAWRSLMQDPGWDAHLAVVGHGADDAAWLQALAASGLGERVHGLKVRGDIHRLYWACDAVVSPTRYEAYGLAVHEALCCGLPAVVSRGAGVAECYPDDLSGLLLLNPEDTGALAARLHRCRAELDLARRRVAPLGERLRSRRWEQVARDVVELVEATVFHRKSLPSHTITERHLS
jgi:glycosyltransferase involved in cell wall biosynthesis